MPNRQFEVRLAWLSLVPALATLAALALIDLHLRNDISPQGIVSFEVCAYSGSCAAILDAWGAGGRVWAGLSLGLDYLFMLLYATAIFLALRVAGDPLPDRFRRATRRLAWSAWAAGVADVIENYALARMLVSSEVMSYAWPAAIAATVKFTILCVTLTWLVALWVYRGVTRRRAPAAE